MSPALFLRDQSARPLCRPSASVSFVSAYILVSAVCTTRTEKEDLWRVAPPPFPPASLPSVSVTSDLEGARTASSNHPSYIWSWRRRRAIPINGSIFSAAAANDDDDEEKKKRSKLRTRKELKRMRISDESLLPSYAVFGVGLVVRRGGRLRLRPRRRSDRDGVVVIHTNTPDS